MTQLVVRALRPSDDDVVRRLFRETLVLGRGADLALPDLDDYEHLCLGWYLGPGRRWAAVLVEAGDDHDDPPVVGYLLACPDSAEQAAWARGPAVRFTLRVLVGRLTRRHPPNARTFWWLRLRDGWRAWRDPSERPAPMHVHLNLDPHVRATRAGRLLVDHADRVCRATGGTAWFGEVNAPAGRRAAALERLGAVVLDRTPNLTFSWARGEPVERLTVLRVLPSLADAPAADQSSSVLRSRSTVASCTPIPAT